MATFRNANAGESLLSKIGNIGLRLVWHVLHLLVSVFYLAMGIVCALESYRISITGLCGFNSAQIKYLAVVIESEEASHISRVVKLLMWLYAIGVKNICLYDEQGVLKKSQKAILEKLDNVNIFKQDGETEKLVAEKCMTLEFASLSDGKEAVVKAANLLFGKYMDSTDLDEDQREKIFTEEHLADALKATGSNGPEPDLLLVYGPARCHLGFPAWRIRYTEIVHMGSLTSMRYGSLVKAVYKFTMVRQNYGK